MSNRIICFLFICFFQSISIGKTSSLDEVYWKRTFSKIFLKSIKKELSLKGQEKWSIKEAKKSLYYNNSPFQAVYEHLINQKSSLQVFEERENLLSREKTFSKLLKWPLQKRQLSKKGKTLISKYNNYFKSPQNLLPKKNYFQRPFGKNLIKELRNTVFIVLSGFGSHLIEEPPFMETLREMNVFYGRNPPLGNRPKNLLPSGKTFFQPHTEFYKNKPIMMDILYPIGDELGNTLGPHDENVKHLEKWINKLPLTYKNKDIVFIGYSKGLTLALEIVKNVPNIQKRTKAIFSLSGPQQGSINLRLVLKDLMKLTQRQSIEDLEELTKNLELRGLLKLIDSELKENYKSEYQKLLKLFYLVKMGRLPKALMNKVEPFLTKESSYFFKGVIEQSPSYRLKWNLENLNDSLFKSPLTIFSLSFLTNVKDFFHKFDSKNKKFKFNNEIMPQLRPFAFDKKKILFPLPFTGDGNSFIRLLNRSIYWKNFSLDSFILHLTSIAAFERSPGGLMDTQIGWADSKSFYLDHRPLKNQFSKEELLEIYQTLDLDKDTLSFYDFLNKERRFLIPKNKRKNLSFIDLGELRGTHWNIPLTQASRIPGSPPHLGHINEYPRKSLLTSILQIYALYKAENAL
jgi:hypothetical protein